MDIVCLSFEDPLMITINNDNIRLVLFKTQEPGNIKFGIEAPRSINVHREEIYRAIQSKQNAIEE
jgi:carbon storage regulator